MPATQHSCGGQKTTFDSWISLFTMDSGVELRSSVLQREHFYLLSHLGDPKRHYFHGE